LNGGRLPRGLVARFSLQRCCKGTRGRIAVRGVLCECPGDDAVPRDRHIGADTRKNRRWIEQMRLQNRELGVAQVGRMPRETMESDTAERVDISPAVDRPALDLLGSAVVDGAEKGAGLGQLSRR